MNKFIQEFKEFAFKGNMIDLAVGVVIGQAFGKIITAMVNDIIMPLVSLVLALTHIPPDYVEWKLFNRFMVGDLLSEIVQFIIVALVVFVVIVKLVGGAMKKATAKPAAPSEPVTKECPKCLMVIPIKATKCGHCTADLPAAA